MIYRIILSKRYLFHQRSRKMSTEAKDNSHLVFNTVWVHIFCLSTFSFSYPFIRFRNSVDTRRQILFFPLFLPFFLFFLLTLGDKYKMHPNPKSFQNLNEVGEKHAGRWGPASTCLKSLVDYVAPEELRDAKRATTSCDISPFPRELMQLDKLIWNWPCSVSPLWRGD